MTQPKFSTVDAYLATFPPQVQAALESVRRAIREAVPQAEEYVSYSMPAYRFHGRLVYFAGFKEHYSRFGATGPGIAKTFGTRLKPYRVGEKGTIRFPLDQPVPVRLIADIARYRAMENQAKARA